MSVCSKESVLIMGAGTSKQFGIPLGSELIQLIVSQIDREINEPANWCDTSLAFTGSPNQQLNQAPLISVATLLCKTNGLNPREILTEMRDLLNEQTAETIDSFIAENPGHSTTTKAFICALLIGRMFNFDGFSFRAANNERRYFERIWRDQNNQRCTASDRNWVHLLINLVRYRILHTKDFSEPVKIINFNYETIFERIVRKKWRQIERSNDLPPWEEAFDIAHVHGRFGSLEDQLPNAPQTAMDWAKNIFVVNEAGHTDAIVEARRKAANWMQNCHRVYSMGFAFSGPNCSLIGLYDKPITLGTAGRNLVYLNYDGNEGLRLAVERCQFLSTTTPPASESRVIRPHDFIRAGYLGELGI